MISDRNRSRADRSTPFQPRCMWAAVIEEAGICAGWMATGEAIPRTADEESFRQLYEAVSRPLWAYLYHVSGRTDVADDLLQESYCRFLMHKTPAMDFAQTRSYLYRIATNLLRDRFRANREEQEPPDRAVQSDVSVQIDVREAMKQLKPRELELLWLAYVEGLNHAEIAAATGLRPLSVRLLLFRARRKAAQLLGPQRMER